METLIILRALLRRWPLILVGMVLAIATALLASGKFGVGPFDATARISYQVITQAQVDSPKPLVADAYRSASAIQTQTILITDYMTSDRARDQIARRAGVPPADLSVATPTIDGPVRPSPLALAGQQAAANYTPYNVTASPWTVSPLITLVASGPDQAIAARLSRVASVR